MKIIFVLMLSLGMCANAFAASDPTGRIEVGASVNGAFGLDDDFDDSVFVAAAVNYGLNPQWAVGISGGWTDPEITADNALGSKTDAGSVRLTPIFFDVIFRAPPSTGSIIPYLNVGIGALLAEQKGNQSLGVNRIEARDSDGYAVRLGGGIDWNVTETLVYNVEFAYVLTGAKVDFVTSNTNRQVSSLDLDYWYAGMGFKYRFE